MGKFISQPEIKTVIIKGKEREIELLDTKEFDKFNPEVLGLGDISLPSTREEAIAAVFDLSGFTKFCSQPDPQLLVPPYLSRFLDWLFDEIKTEFVRKSYEGGKQLWANLPFLAKFLGDGVLFLWDTTNMNGYELCNVIVSLRNICLDYKKIFYPGKKRAIGSPPKTLKCGIARGSVFSVGNGDDYVGPCINIASRLQKLSLLTFCASRKGFDFEKYMHKNTAPKYIVKYVTLRGIGKNQLVLVYKSEFDSLKEKEKKIFRNP